MDNILETYGFIIFALCVTKLNFAGIAIQNDGKIVATRHTFRLVSSIQTESVVVRINANGTADNSFGVAVVLTNTVKKMNDLKIR